MSVSREVSRFIGWIILNDMYDTLKRFGVLRWAGEDGENCVRTFGKILAMLVLVNIAIQMVCLWPVRTLNLVGHNEKYWLTSDCVTLYLFTFHFIFFTITHWPLNHTVQIHVPCTACEVISFNSWTTFLSLLVVKCLPSTMSFCSVYIITFVTLLKPLCCFYRGPHKPVFISQSMPWLCAEVSNWYLFFTGHCWFFLHLWYDDSPRDCLETTNRSFSRGRGE